MNQILLAAPFLVTLALVQAGATGLVNTEAGTFRCGGSIVRVDRHGVPSSADPGREMKPCEPVAELKDTI